MSWEWVFVLLSVLVLVASSVANERSGSISVKRSHSFGLPRAEHSYYK